MKPTPQPPSSLPFLEQRQVTPSIGKSKASCPEESIDEPTPRRSLRKAHSSSNRSSASVTSASGSKRQRQVTPSVMPSVTPSIRRSKKSCHEESIIHQPTPRRSQRILKRKRSEAESTIETSRKSQRRAGNGIGASPSPSSSIRTSARITSISGSQGRREYNGSAYKHPRQKEDTGLKYNLEDAVTRLFPSSPNPGHDKVFDDDDGPRHCYCDEYCEACTPNTPCKLHGGFFCSGGDN